MSAGVVHKALAFCALVLGCFILINGLLGGVDDGPTQHRQELLDEYTKQTIVPSPTMEPDLSGSNKYRAVIRIPALGKNWVQPIVAGVSDDVLDSGVVGRFPESTVPGGEGNYSLTAHRVTHGEPFKDLPAVDKGDLVLVDSHGVRYTYTVTKKWVVNYQNVSVLAPVGKDKIITLITCDSYTQHTDNRLVIRGQLTSVEAL